MCPTPVLSLARHTNVQLHPPYVLPHHTVGTVRTYSYVLRRRDSYLSNSKIASTWRVLKPVVRGAEPGSEPGSRPVARLRVSPRARLLGVGESVPTTNVVGTLWSRPEPSIPTEQLAAGVPQYMYMYTQTLAVRQGRGAWQARPRPAHHASAPRELYRWLRRTTKWQQMQLAGSKRRQLR